VKLIEAACESPETQGDASVMNCKHCAHCSL
jgi:hypothetical protein